MILRILFQNRLWQRDFRDLRAIQPDAGYYNDVRKIVLFAVLGCNVFMYHSC